MPKPSAEQAISAVSKANKIKDAIVVDSAVAHHPETGKAIHRYRVVSAAKANDSAFDVFYAENGEALAAESVAALFAPPVAAAAVTALPAAPVTIDPNVNILTLNPGETFHETITVTIPKNSAAAKADVYFLADTTGSMSGILAAVQAGANNILTALNGLGIDIVFGVGNYKDLADGPANFFKHQVSPTNVAATVTAGINAWSAAGGGDLPEGQLLAFDKLAVPPGGGIGWRPGSKRIIVWFGDAAGHDPICAAISGTGADITEASITAKLVAEQITVLAISTAKPGLDDDPKSGATDYQSSCGPVGGAPGQATRIANATGGTFVTGINPGTIVNTIINLVKAAVAGINNVKLVPSPSIAPFVTSITPAAGYGPLNGETEHVLKFEVTFTGIPCKAETQVINGTLDVVADGTVVAQKRVEITVPPCPAFVYVVKFVCGTQPECGCECTPVQPGRYSTEINIHNSGLKEVNIAKRFIPVVLAGAPVGREPRVATVKAEDKIVLPAQAATMDDCCRIAELLYGGQPASPMPLTIGYLELTASANIAVTAVYTTSGLKGGGVSIAVEQIAGRRQ
ncbi:MAG: hypothetical protein U0Q16_27550 [Bryobacteraceae bacterium]